MKLTLKNVFLSVGMFAFTLVLIGALSTNKAEAAAITATLSGSWNTAGNWSGGVVPGSGDDVVIPSNITMNVTAAATAGSLTMNATTGNPAALNINSGFTLAVSGAVTLSAPAGSGYNDIAVTGTLTAPSVSIVGSATGYSGIRVQPSGTLTIANNVVLSGTAANARLTAEGTGAKTIYITQNLTNGGTVLYTGTSVTSSVMGTTTTSTGGSITLSDTTGTYTFTGAFTVNLGGVYNETVPGTSITFGGIFYNNGISTISTGTHTWAGVTNTGTFNLANTTIPTFTASTLGTINYNGVTQSVLAVGYKNLTLSGSGVKTLAANAGSAKILGTLAISGTTVDLTGDSEANALTIGGIPMRVGIWGSATSTAATYKNAAFTNDSNYVTVATCPTCKKLVYLGDINPGDGTTTTTSGGNTVTADVTPPSGTSVSINAGALTTSSLSTTLSFTAVDATEMIVSSDAGFAGATWETFATSKPFAFIGADGVKTVYAKFRDALGNMSQAVSDTITVVGSGVIVINLSPISPIEPTQGCSAGNLYNTSTGALCVNNAGVQIPGCGNGTTGFSTATGGSCALNRVTGGTTYDLGTVTLKNGSKGDAVMELQRLLNQVLSLGLVVDGKLGPKTIAVIKTWQKNHNLVADGLVGKLTKAAMKLEAEK